MFQKNDAEHSNHFSYLSSLWETLVIFFSEDFNFVSLNKWHLIFMHWIVIFLFTHAPKKWNPTGGSPQEVAKLSQQALFFYKPYL